MRSAVAITVKGPWYFSAKDEELFFLWLNSIPSVVAVRGVLNTLEISLTTKRISQRDLRELLALFHRYAIDKSVLAQFDRPQLTTWFRDPEAYWYADVFGKPRRSAKRR
jgi:hypothetical protein